MDNTEDCPVKIQKMINELKKDHLGALDYFLAKAYNLTLEQKSSWLKLRCVLVGKETVTTRLELCSYEDHLCNMQDFLKDAAKQTQNQQKKRGIATLVNTVPILLTDSEDEVTNIQSTSKPNGISVKRTKWTTPVSISDINDQPVAIRDIRNSPRDTQYLPRHHAQPEINQRIPLHSNELIVHEQNFNERPPPVIPRDGHFNKAQSNQYFRKNTINNPRVSHYQNDRQPHSSSRPERQESYRDYKLRKEQAERIARAKNQTNRTVPSRNSQHLNEESSSSLSSNLITAFEPSSSSSSNLITALEPILSEFQMNFVATSNESIINEPVEVAQPPPLEMAQSLPMEMVQSLPMEMVQPSPLEMTQSPLLEMDDDFFKTIIPQLDESYIRTYREIKEETGFEILPPDEETFTEECPVENANNEIQPFVKQEPEEHFSNMDENTADFIEHYQIIKAEPIDRQSITFQ